MFTLRAKPNPLTTFGANLAEGLADRYVEDKQLAQRNAEIKKGFEALGENPSRMQILQTIEGLRIPDEQKKRLYQGFGDIERDKLNREKYKKEQDKEEKAQIRKKKLAQQYEISEEEAEGLEPQDIPALARSKNKAIPGGVQAQAIPPEIVQKLEEIRTANPNASGIEFQRQADLAGVPRVWSKPESDLLSKRDEIKSQDPYFKAAQQNQAKANVALADDAISKGETAKKNLLGIEGMRKNIKSTGFNLRNRLADATGIDAWRDPKSEEFKTYAKQSLLKAAEIVKGKVSNYEFQTIGDLYANVDKSPEANEAILDWQEYLEKVDDVRGKEARKILKENGGIPPPDFGSQLDDRTDGAVEKLTQEWRKKKEKTQAKMIKRKPVAKGTPATEEVAKQYLMKAQVKLPGANQEQILNEAEKMAREDGYAF